MALFHDVETLEQHILGELDAAYDYKEHTSILWRLFQRWVQQGHTVKSKNVDTGTVVTEQELVGLAQRYNSEYLLEFTFQHFVTLSETFLFDLLRLLLIDHPERRLSLNKKVEVATILSAPDRPGLVALLAERELNELKYKNVAKWFEHLKDLVKISSPIEVEIRRYAEVKASRDILVHNAKIVNAIYVSKAGDQARYRVGERMEIPGWYHRESWLLLKKMIQDLSAEVKAKFAS